MQNYLKNTPSIIIIGPLKTGTTWLYQYIKQHPYLGTTLNVKETHFFDLHYEKGINWYARQFPTTDLTIIEVAPTYFDKIDAPARISSVLEIDRLICILRNPVDQTISHYYHRLKYGYTKKSFREEVIAEELYQSCLYSYHLNRWNSIFGNEKIGFLQYELLKSNPESFVEKFCQLAGVKYWPISRNLKRPINVSERRINNFNVTHFFTKLVNILRKNNLHILINVAKKIGLKSVIYSGYKSLPKITKEERLWLYKTYFRQDICLLEEMLKQSFDKWKMG